MMVEKALEVRQRPPLLDDPVGQCTSPASSQLLPDCLNGVWIPLMGLDDEHHGGSSLDSFGHVKRSLLVFAQK